MTIGRPVAGVCVSTALFVCGVAGFPAAPASLPPSSGPVVLDGSSTGTPTPFAAGSSFTVAGGGFAGNGAVTISVYSQPRELAHVVASSAGDVSATVQLPSDLVGLHTVSAIGNDPTGAPRSLEAQVNVLAAAATPLSLPRTGLSVAGMLVGGLGLIVAGFVLIRTVAFRRKLLPS